MSTSATARGGAPRSTDLIAAAQGLTGIAALVLGLTYAVGASLRAGELREAGVDVREGMAVIPIEQLLTRGIDALVDPRNVALFVALTVLGLVAAATGASMRASIQADRRRVDQQFAEIREAVRERARAGDISTEEMEDELEHLERARAEERARVESWAEELPRAFETRVGVWAATALVAAVVVFVPWVFALAVVGGLAVLALIAFLASRGGRGPRASALFAGMLVVVAVGIMVEGQVKPREAVPVELALKEEAPEIVTPFAADGIAKMVSGRLVAVTDDAWYVSSSERSDADDMLTIARDDVAAAVTGSVNRESESLVELIF